MINVEMIKFQILLCGRVTGNMEFTIDGFIVDNCNTEYVGICMHIHAYPHSKIILIICCEDVNVVV